MVKNEDGNADKSYDYLCQGHSHGTDGRRLNVHQLLHRAQSLVHTHIHTARQPCTHTPESSSASTQTHKYKEGVNGKRGLGKSVSKGWTGLGGHKGRNSKLLFREMLEHQLMWEGKKIWQWEREEGEWKKLRNKRAQNDSDTREKDSCRGIRTNFQWETSLF